jgi:pimeloyl-ACP methyl ester carboxylesterase
MNEQTIRFGDRSGLVGTLSLPAAASHETGDIGFVFLNTGIVSRVGTHRISVRLARQFAALGVASIRFDLAGHGDSARPRGETSFQEQAVVDIRAAMDALGAATGIRRFAIFGMCSGAYHGYAAALADERVAGVLMFDAFRYPTIWTHVHRCWERAQQPRALRAAMGAVLEGVRALERRVRGSASDEGQAKAPQLGRLDFIPTKQQFGRGLKALVDKGVKIHMIYSGGALREYNYANQFRDCFAHFVGDRINADFLPDLDHVATALADQADLMRRVIDWGADLRRDCAGTVA